MERNLLRYIWGHSRKDQLWMVVIILASMPTYFLSLELPKRIVNQPISGVGFENPGDTHSFLQFHLPFGETLFGHPVVLFSGFDFERIDYLMVLSFSFLFLVVANGLFKLYINTFKGRMGERILRRLRFELFDRVLRYPLSRFRRTKASEIASMIKDEVEPMGEFIGDAFTQPLFLGGQALVALLFIMLQNFWLGVATLVVIAFQAWLIPVLRKRLIQLGKQRQIVARTLAGRIGEVVEGIQEVHTNDTSNRERAELTNILGRLFFIRFELFQRKFSVKFINNFLIQFLAFFFYAVGGYLAIRGTLDIGQLIGVIVAYKDLPGPVRGLIDHDQKRLIVETRYNQILEQFVADTLQDEASQAVPSEPVLPIKQGYNISRLSVKDDTGGSLLEQISVDIDHHEKIAVVGQFGSGAKTFAEVLAKITPISNGRVLLDGKSLVETPEYVTGRRLAYLDGTTYFPQGSILDCLVYVLANQPMQELVRDEAELRQFKLEMQEVARSDNFPLDYEADWIDYERLGVTSRTELIEKIANLLKDIRLEEDVRAFGLRGKFDQDKFPDLAGNLLEARSRFRKNLDSYGFADVVELFDPKHYNNQSSIADNILFGTAIDPDYAPENLASNKLVIEVLQTMGLEESLFAMGKEIASTTLELFGDLDPDNPFFDQLTYMEADELPEYRATLGRLGTESVSQANEADKILIMRLAFAYIEDRNRLGLLDDALKEQLVSARQQLQQRLEQLPDNPVAFYEPEAYNDAASIQDNILLGRISSSVAEGYEKVTAAIRDLLDEMGLTDDIFRIGLEFNVGSGGKRLSEVQRQKLHLARAILKQPDILIVNQGLNTLGAREQEAMIDLVLDNARAEGENGFGIIWVPINTTFAEKFDRILVFKEGGLASDGPSEKVAKDDPVFLELLN